MQALAISFVASTIGGLPTTVPAILIGVILGPLLEQYFLRAMKMSQGDLSVLFSSNIGNALWVGLALSLILPYFMDWSRSRKKLKAIDAPED